MLGCHGEPFGSLDIVGLVETLAQVLEDANVVLGQDIAFERRVQVFHVFHGLRKRTGFGRCRGKLLQALGGGRMLVFQRLGVIGDRFLIVAILALALLEQAAQFIVGLTRAADGSSMQEQHGSLVVGATPWPSKQILPSSNWAFARPCLPAGQPFRSVGTILLHAFAKVVHLGHGELREHIGLLGRLQIPAKRGLQILGKQLAFAVDKAQAILGRCRALLRGALQPCDTCCGIPLYCFALQIKGSEQILRIEISGVCSLMNVCQPCLRIFFTPSAPST